MIPDIDLMRKIVLAVEGKPFGAALLVDGYPKAQVGYHSHLLLDAGLAKGVDTTTGGGDGPQALITSLTLAGHEFAAFARDDATWESAKADGTLTLGSIRKLIDSRQNQPRDGVSVPGSVTALRTQLSRLRDASLSFFDKAEKVRGETHPSEEWQYRDQPSVWPALPSDLQETADRLRAELRPLMVQISKALRGSPLLTEADFRDLGHNGKTMAAALRFREFRQWGLQVHHDEGTILGVDPASQEEVELRSVAGARVLFTESYRAVSELIDYWSPRDGAVPVSAIPGAENVRSYRQNTAFLLMWINPDVPELDDVRDTVHEVFKAFNIKATRADEIEHEGVITERIIQEITTSEFLFADLTGERPSVYYEVGYAHAIGKRVILFKKKGSKIHFDLAAYNCPDYDSLGDLRRKLTSRLQALTNKAEAD